MPKRRSRWVVLVAAVVTFAALVVGLRVLPHTAAWDWIAYREVPLRFGFPTAWELRVLSLERRDWIRRGPSHIHRVHDYQGELLVVSHTRAVTWMRFDDSMFIADRPHHYVWVSIDSSGRVVAQPGYELDTDTSPAQKISATAHALRRPVTIAKQELSLTDAAHKLGDLLTVPVVLDCIHEIQRAVRVTLDGGTVDEALRGALTRHGLAYGIELDGSVRVHGGAAPPALDVAALGKTVVILDLPITVELDGVTLQEVLDFLAVATGHAIHYDLELVGGKTVKNASTRDSGFAVFVPQLLAHHQLVLLFRPDGELIVVAAPTPEPKSRPSTP